MLLVLVFSSCRMFSDQGREGAEIGRESDLTLSHLVLPSFTFASLYTSAPRDPLLPASHTAKYLSKTPATHLVASLRSGHERALPRHSSAHKREQDSFFTRCPWKKDVIPWRWYIYCSTRDGQLPFHNGLCPSGTPIPLPRRRSKLCFGWGHGVFTCGSDSCKLDEYPTASGG